MSEPEPAPDPDISRAILRTAAEIVQRLAADSPAEDRDPLMRIKRLLCGAGEEVERLRARVAGLEAALSRIRDECGQVCSDFMTCDHPPCASSYEAWSIAAEVLESGKPGEDRDGIGF